MFDSGKTALSVVKGTRLLRGLDLSTADEIASGFVATMAAIGKRGKALGSAGPRRVRVNQPVSKPIRHPSWAGVR